MNFKRLILPATIMLVALAGCATGKQDNDTSLPESHTTDASNQPFFKAVRKVGFEDAGRFIMVEGSQCTEQANGPEPATMLITHDMPAYVNNGTVILNGWDLRYLHSDHEVRTLRADITHSKLVTGGGGPPVLVFEVAGELSDQNWDDPYEFCVYYTGLGFNSAWINARIEGDYNGISTQALQIHSEGPIATLESLWDSGTLKGHDSMVVIPRGFDFQYDNQFECEFRFPPCRWNDPADHHLRQVAYSLFQTDASPNPDGNPHWVTQTIFKDSGTRTHWVRTRAALIGGESVKLRASFLPLNPRSGRTSICRNGTDGIVHTETFRIYDLPYDYAVPMLTGWNLDYECDHQHVQRAGIWIHDIRFDPDSNGLEYKLSSILRDKNGAPGFNASHRISVLGFNRSSIPPVVVDDRPAPDIQIRLRKQHLNP
ncbi:hypothetical protein SAMN05216326_10637 [Nitrosomonas marina]|uniref:Lipoprotein n=1 Tax=Nitrosomonas marina TaxID=917 RepID=A0A1I0A5W8_9PROT|nr:hypothetical protein [Nitrosomonas marina]SES89068.1 hypothetical protein SAMN05216326_10637 [Nitrosomonas marina]